MLKYYNIDEDGKMTPVNEIPAVGLSELHDLLSAPTIRHAMCKGTMDTITGEYDCGYKTAITCDECKYGVGRKDPEAKCNQLSR